MKKVLVQFCTLSILSFFGFLFSYQNIAYAANTIKIYPTSDAVGQLYDDDAISDWTSARNYQGELFRTPFESGLFDNVGNIAVRSDNGVGTYRIYRVSDVFDLSDIPANANLTKATLKLYKSVPNNRGDISVVITSHHRDSPSVYQKKDWVISNFGNKEFSRSVLFDAQYTDFTFNNDGLNYLQSRRNDLATIGILTNFDFDNIIPQGYILAAGWYEVEKNGTEFDPYLEITYTVPEENDFPLYTQIASLYPSLPQTTDWEDDTFAYGSREWCGNTIGGCGCAITSAVMAGRNANITTDVVGGDVNPKNINEYLRSVGGYTSDGSVYWLAMQAYMGELTDDGRLASRFQYVGKYEGAAAMSAADQYLENEGEYAVLAFKNSIGHFVWLPAKTNASYVVRDPFWYLTQTADDATGTDVKDYNNSFDSVRVFEVSEVPIVASGSGVEAYLKGTAELIYKDTVGNTVGYTSSGTVVDLPNSSYGNAEVVGLNGTPSPNAGGKHLLVSDASNKFTIEVVGTGTGGFEIEFFTISETGEVTTYTFSGQTIPGVTSTFTFDLDTGEVTEQAITYEQFVNILNTQMAGYSVQQQKFFIKWAEKIFSDMENKTVSQAIQSIDVYKKLLIAKKIESLILTPVLDLIQGKLKK